MKKKFIKISSVVMTVALVLGLVLSGVVAADESENQPSTTAAQAVKILKGKVTEIDTGKTFFVVQSGDQDPVTVKVDANTRYYTLETQQANPKLEQAREKIQEKIEKTKEQLQQRLEKAKDKIIERGLGKKNGQVEQDENNAQGEDTEDLPANIENKIQNKLQGAINSLHRFGEKAAFEDIAVGDAVVVRLMPNENLAKEVLIVKVQPSVFSKVNGIITAVDNDSITIKKADNTEVEIKWDANTQFVLKGLISVEAGQTATAVYNTETMLAKVVHMVTTPPAPTTTSTTNT